MEGPGDVLLPKSDAGHARRAVMWVLALNAVVMVAALMLWNTQMLTASTLTFAAATLAVMVPLDMAVILYHAAPT